MIQLTICHPPYSPLNLQKIDPFLSGSDLKTKLKTILPTEIYGNCGEEEEVVGNVRLVCGGRVIQDHLRLDSQGIVDKSKIYVSITKNTTSPTSTTSTGSSNRSKAPTPQGNDPMMGPLLKFLSENPELYQQMLMSNPQMQKLIEKNPELRHALSDPSTLKSMLNAATNPKAYNEMLRGHDRAISNLENIPEGFSHLKRVYSTLQEPMYDAFTPKTRQTKSEDVNTSVRTTTTTTSEPIPNPWAPRAKPTPPMMKSPTIFGSRSNKRRLASDDELLFAKSLTGLTGSTSSSSSNSSSNNPSNSNNSSASPLPASFSKELEAMHALGFKDDEGENLEALRQSNGNVEEAVDIILKHRAGRK